MAGGHTQRAGHRMDVDGGQIRPDLQTLDAGFLGGFP